ncbi:3'-5' exonuclease family protein [Puniceicoccus vermicola]|uniref:hypothetical protein n=1 Tax=Puniceicoccus vermicola TaxID=388746 RepID=UPI003CCDC387
MGLPPHLRGTEPPHRPSRPRRTARTISLPGCYLPIGSAGWPNPHPSLNYLRISKAARVSNWEQNPLTKKQINYTATDAWVSLRIYEELNRRTGQAVPGEQLAQ